ncbi:MAG: PIG-L family deacetylase, partial [Kiritimatiellia bacterium]|nr:PIG-L family deacetylase [Kiritimatiellia bacterium]
MSEHPYRSFAQTFETALKKGRKLPLGGFSALAPAPTSRKAPLAMLLSPHPDDECIIGVLPLRLMRKAGWRALNVAVTLGSRLDRRKGRWQELRNACAFLGFDVTRVVAAGLDKINPKGRASDPENWATAVAKLAELIQKKKPRVLLFPHLRDWNGTHIGTGLLAREALAKTDFDGFIVETEFWGAM